MRAQDVKNMIENNLENTQAHVQGDDGRHFDAVVISPLFEGKNRIQKQQLVHSALGDNIANGSIHAISIKTFTPNEWREHNKG